MKKEYMTRRVTLNADSLTWALVEATVELTAVEEAGAEDTIYGVTMGLAGSVVNSNLKQALFPDKEDSAARTITGQEYAAAAAEALHDLLTVPERVKMDFTELMSRSTVLGHGALILFTAAEKFFGRDEEEPAEEENHDDN